MKRVVIPIVGSEDSYYDLNEMAVVSGDDLHEHSGGVVYDMSYLAVPWPGASDKYEVLPHDLVIGIQVSISEMKRHDLSPIPWNMTLAPLYHDVNRDQPAKNERGETIFVVVYDPSLERIDSEVSLCQEGLDTAKVHLSNSIVAFSNRWGGHDFYIMSPLSHPKYIRRKI